jgi:hypothetical protein
VGIVETGTGLAIFDRRGIGRALVQEAPFSIVESGECLRRGSEALHIHNTSRVHCHTTEDGNLAFDLLLCPSGGLMGAWHVVTVLTNLLDESSNPISSVVVSKFTLREGVCKITNSVLVLSRFEDSK